MSSEVTARHKMFTNVETGKIYRIEELDKNHEMTIQDLMELYGAAVMEAARAKRQVAFLRRKIICQGFLIDWDGWKTRTLCELEAIE